METKLTLRLERKIVEQAKIIAKRNKTSLSRMVENYFLLIFKNDENQKIEISPRVKKLTGILEGADIENYRRDIANIIEEKHVKGK